MALRGLNAGKLLTEAPVLARDCQTTDMTTDHLSYRDQPRARRLEPPPAMRDLEWQ
jgi:hypothetical protein